MLPVATATLFSLWTAPAAAQTTSVVTTAPGLGTQEPQDSESKWGIGVAGGINYQVYRGFDDKVRGLPLITYENKWVHVFGPGVDVKLPSLGPVSFRLRGRYIGEGYEDDDSPYLDGMRDRDSSFWVGGVATWNNDIANLSAEVLGDVMGNSDGFRARLQVDRRFAAGAVGFTPRIAAEWVDGNYVDYYYGVRAGEVRAGRRAYEGGSTVNAEIGLRVDWQPVPKHTVFLDLGATRMGSSIRNSPLVDESTRYGVGLGYLYRF